MKSEYLTIIEEYENQLCCQQSASELSAFFKLLFDQDDCIQIKEKNRTHPADAVYANVDGANDSIDKRHSDSGIQFCINAIPGQFLEKRNHLGKIESMCDSRWEQLIHEMRNDLTLSASLFDRGRTFFIEADNLPNGESIASVADKMAVLTELLASDLPISYVIDTGGRGPHIGIALEDSVSRDEFDQFVREVMQRLPAWIDSGVGRVNQLERVPGTSRVNKLGRTVAVKLIHLAQRVNNKTLRQWINAHPIINANVAVKSSPSFEDGQWVHDYEPEGTEEAAWNFIEEHGLKHSKKIRGGKIQISCPQPQNHKSGKDRNMSAFISVDTGHVWCSACQDTVGWTLPIGVKPKTHPSPLIPSQAESCDLSMIKPSKLF